MFSNILHTIYLLTKFNKNITNFISEFTSKNNIAPIIFTVMNIELTFYILLFIILIIITLLVADTRTAVLISATIVNFFLISFQVFSIESRKKMHRKKLEKQKNIKQQNAPVLNPHLTYPLAPQDNNQNDNSETPKTQENSQPKTAPQNKNANIVFPTGQYDNHSRAYTDWMTYKLLDVPDFKKYQQPPDDHCSSFTNTTSGNYVRQTRARGNRQRSAINGSILKDANYYRYHFADDLKDSEKQVWWSEYEEPV
jgi:hypothetical protein